jgi:hypothetical protein
MNKYPKGMWSIKFCGYSTRIVRHKRSYNIMEYFIMYFITLDLRFIINSVVLKTMEINETKKKKTRKWIHHPQKWTQDVARETKYGIKHK